MTKTLNVIGAGKVGKVLGRLWHAHQTFTIHDVLNRSIESAQHATDFIGAGRALGDSAFLRPADIYLIATPDDQIAQCCERIAQVGLLSDETIVFHCSGALSSAELKAARNCGAAVASIHPIRSFASPDQVAINFAGTFCGVEGDERALDLLRAGFTAIGARFVSIDPASKIIYHAASVFACNYLTTLLEVAKQSYVKAGVPSDTALRLMEPLVRETVNNIFDAGPADALTGPLARGDMQTVEKQYNAVSDWDDQYGQLYRIFIEPTLRLKKK